MDIFKNSIRVFIIINFFSVNAAETFFPLFFFLREKKKQSCQGWGVSAVLGRTKFLSRIKATDRAIYKSASHTAQQN